MTITAALILLALTFVIVFFIVMQSRTETQSDSSEEVVAGTSASAPAGEHVRSYAIWALVISLPIWLFEIWLIHSGWLTIEMFDFYNIVGDD